MWLPAGYWSGTQHQHRVGNTARNESVKKMCSEMPLILSRESISRNDESDVSGSHQEVVQFAEMGNH